MTHVYQQLAIGVGWVLAGLLLGVMCWLAGEARDSNQWIRNLTRRSDVDSDSI